MMKANFKTLIYLLALVTGLWGCTYETLDPEVVVVPEEVSFATDVILIFNKSCNTQGCHSKSGISPDLTADNAYISLTFFGYVDTGSPATSGIYQVINTGTMRRYATDQDRAIILKWIEQGAENN